MTLEQLTAPAVAPVAGATPTEPTLAEVTARAALARAFNKPLTPEVMQLLQADVAGYVTTLQPPTTPDPTTTPEPTSDPITNPDPTTNPDTATGPDPITTPDPSAEPVPNPDPTTETATDPESTSTPGPVGSADGAGTSADIATAQ